MNTARWTVEDYHRMIDTGILNNRSVELLRGKIVEMSPESPLHSATNDNVAEYLREALRGKARVREAHPITLMNSEPEPDIAIVRLTSNNYSDRHPFAEDIYWLIEISNTTLEEDLGIKKTIYANAGIKEYWVINLKAQEIIVFREPFKNNYTTKFTIDEGIIFPLAFPNLPIEVGKLL